jgi:hypothetical protein
VGELTVVEICTGAGGQALGLEQAGFSHAAAIEFTDCRTCTCFFDLGFCFGEHVWDVAVPTLRIRLSHRPQLRGTIRECELVHHQESAIPCLS